MFPRGEEQGKDFNSVASWPVASRDILAVDASVNWETPPGASGGRVLSTFLPLLDLPTVVNIPFYVLSTYYLRDSANLYAAPIGGGGAVVKTLTLILATGGTTSFPHRGHSSFSNFFPLVFGKFTLFSSNSTRYYYCLGGNSMIKLIRKGAAVSRVAVKAHEMVGAEIKIADERIWDVPIPQR
jgi:hypothetical protein